MRKAWRETRQVVVRPLDPGPDDRPRAKRLAALLATGVERLLKQERQSGPEPVDFCRDVPPTTPPVDTTEGARPK